MHSLINITRRKDSKEDYFQARFFDKSGRYIQAITLPKSIKTHTEAYLIARKKLEQIFTSTSSKDESPLKDEIEQYGILSVDEVKSILNLKDENKTIERDTLITLLGVTCGLRVSEIRNLRREQIQSNDMLLVETGDKKRIIPFIGKVKERINKMNFHFPESKYVIPNLRNMNKPCDPISITRGLESALKRIGIGKERNILPSVLWETFVSLLLETNKGVSMETIDCLCGFSVSTPNIESNKIRLIDSLMIRLENKSWSQIGHMNW